MDRNRIVGVHATAAGSGYLLAPRLVLTSAHLAENADTPTSVFVPGVPVTYRGSVVWRGDPDGCSDAALVHITDPVWTPPTVSSPRWGRTVTQQPGLPCQTWGFPAFARPSAAVAEIEQVTGSLNPGDGYVADRYIIKLDKHPPEDLNASPWRGMSGAAVYSGELLMGVVSAALVHRGNAALGVVPAYLLLDDPDFSATVERYAGATALRWEAAELQHLRDPQAAEHAAGVARTPAPLLTAHRAIVPFRPGREGLLSELTAWADEPHVSAWLIHGRGGQGKTRLACHFSDLMAGQGWAVLWLTPDSDRADLRIVREVRSRLLIIIDYADARVEQVAALCAELHRSPSSQAIKVLLTARTNGPWWQETSTRSDAAADVIDSARISELAPLDQSREARTSTYRASMTAFAEAMEAMPTGPRHDWKDLSARIVNRQLVQDPGDGVTVLAVQMAALADLLDAGLPPAPGVAGSRAVEERVLIHERRYWGYTAREQRLDFLGSALLGDLVAACVVSGPAIVDDLESVLNTIPELTDQPLLVRARLRSWLMSMYPGTGPGLFGGLAPDRVAERLVGRIMDDRDRPCVLSAVVDTITDHPAAVRFLTVCTRAATHPDLAFAGERLTGWCMQHRKTLMLAAIEVITRSEEPDPLLTALHRVIEDTTTDLGTLLSYQAVLPTRTVALASTAVILARTVSTRTRNATPRADVHRQLLAYSLNELAMRLLTLGPSQEALAAATEAFQIRSELAIERPAECPTALESLNIVQLTLGAMGRWDQALAVVDCALATYRMMPFSLQVEHIHDIALIVNNRAQRLLNTGRPEEAADAARAAVALHLTLDQGGHGQTRDNLAMSLHNLAQALRARCLFESALAAAESCVQIRRAAAEDNPDAMLPQLRLGLITLSDIEAHRGNSARALDAAQEALLISRRLDAQSSHATRESLIHSLNNHAIRLGEVGLQYEALESIEEAVRLCSEMHDLDSALYLPQMAMCLHNRAVRFGTVGRLDDRLADSTAALHMYRLLAETHPDIYLPDVAMCLGNHAENLCDLGHHEQALAAARRALRIRQGLAEHDPVAQLPEVVVGYQRLALILILLNRRPEARRALRGAEAARLKLHQIRNGRHSVAT
ncbi:tetratricopeptide repeat protein [Nocardia aurea]|uniref:tetratricopeptide repeat protein n=1 Tax=Nocardia aurea TaxID=2144174 RepID=UPI0033BD2688